MRITKKVMTANCSNSEMEQKAKDVQLVVVPERMSLIWMLVMMT